MKKLFLAASIFVNAQLHAQNCTDYFFLQKGKTIEMTLYWKTGQSMKQVYHVENVSSSGNVTTAVVNVEVIAGGRSSVKSVNTIKCNGGNLLVNMKMSMPTPQGDKDIIEAKSQEFYIEYPANMSVGDQLKDGILNLDDGFKMVVQDRKVQGKEKITTPAGTWDCFRITQKTKITITGIHPIDVETTEWYAPGFGVVKTQSDKMRTEITSIK